MLQPKDGRRSDRPCVPPPLENRPQGRPASRCGPPGMPAARAGPESRSVTRVPTPARRVAEQRGRQGERIAGWWLRLKGWSILARRVRTPAGEVDIIARRGAMVAFIEVKVRASEAALAEAIDERRLRRVAAAAEALAAVYLQPGDDMRLDVMLLAPGRPPRHLENVWHGG